MTDQHAAADTPASPSQTPFPADQLAALASPEIQRQAASSVQDAFARLMQLTVDGDQKAANDGVVMLTNMARNWARAAGTPDAAGLRLAMLIAGLDQWGMAYSRMFGLTAIPALTEMIGMLRAALDPVEDAHFQRQYAALDAVETDAIDFKIALRRGLHQALWASMLSTDDEASAFGLADGLGSLMLALTRSMPQHGWRLLADALAHMQIRQLSEGLAASGVAAQANQRLFESLLQALPTDQRRAVQAYATQAVMGWHSAQRQAS